MEYFPKYAARIYGYFALTPTPNRNKANPIPIS